jgi:ADP-heptose:LPS heptosyltransferase
MSDNAIQRITLLSFRTFGDYVLKAPFLFELNRRYPNAAVTMITNRKGGQVYPLVDSRLKLVVVDHGDRMLPIFRKLRRLEAADLVIALDDSRTTLILSLVVRGKRKTGWVQGISLLYAEGGFFAWKSVQPWLSKLVKAVYRPGRIRQPEDKYDGDVELELLDLRGQHQPLASYRGKYAALPAMRPAMRPAAQTEQPYIYCAAEAGWRARQLTDEQWAGILRGLLQAFPQHTIVVHGAAAAVEEFGPEPRVVSYGQKSVVELFEKISAAALVIAPDSFALHLASFYDVPAIGYFGPAHPRRFRPSGPGSISLFHQPECSPCLQLRGNAPCRKGLSQCSSLAAMQPSEFITAAKAVLA